MLKIKLNKHELKEKKGKKYANLNEPLLTFKIHYL
jgi:hypothetical protein